MLQSSVVGNLGADAVYNNQQGHEFISFRVAHTDRWKDASGQQHSATTWVDCVINGKPAVLEYLKRGTLVYCSGHTSLRVYSSKKDRCMKAGLQINVRQIELLGGAVDAVPSRLYTEDGILVDVKKYYHVDNCSGQLLLSMSGGRFIADGSGWVFAVPGDDASQQADVQQEQQSQQSDAEQSGDIF